MADVYFKIDGDLDKLMRIRQEVFRLEDAIRSTSDASEQMELEKKLAAANKELSETTERLSKIGAADLSALKKKMDSVRAVFTDTSLEVDRLRGELKKLEADRQLLMKDKVGNKAGIVNIDQQIAEVKGRMATMETIRDQMADVMRGSSGTIVGGRGSAGMIADLMGGMENFRNAVSTLPEPLREVLGEINNVTRAFSEGSSAAEGFGGLVKGAIGAAAVVGASQFISKLIAIRGQFQDLESSMKVFLGSAEKATEFVDKLSDYAWYNMFEFKDLAQESSKLLAYGTHVSEVIGVLDKLSNVAAGTQGSLSEMVDAYNRAKNIGYVDSRALQSWAAKGLVVKDVLKEMGETAVGSRVTFEQLNSVLDYVNAEGGMFHNLMGEQLNNLSASKGQLDDDITQMFNDIGKATEDYLKMGIDASDYLVSHYKEIGETLMWLVGIYGTYRVSLAAVTKMETLSRLFSMASGGAGQFAGIMNIASKAMTNFGGAISGALMALSPWALAITAVAASVAYLVTADNYQETAQKKVNDELERSRELYDDLSSKASGYMSTIKSQTATEYERIKAYKELIKLYPKLGKSLSDIEGMSRSDAMDSLTESINETKVQEMRDRLEEMERSYGTMSDTITVNQGSASGFTTRQVVNADKQILAEQIELYKKELEEEEEALRQSMDKRTGLVKYKEAEQNRDLMQDILDRYNSFMQTLEGADLGDVITFTESSRDQLDYNLTWVESKIQEVEAKKDDVNSDPLVIEAQLSSLERLKAQMLKQKEDLEQAGDTSITMNVDFRFDIETAKDELDSAIGTLRDRAKAKEQEQNKEGINTQIQNLQSEIDGETYEYWMEHPDELRKKYEAMDKLRDNLAQFSDRRKAFSNYNRTRMSSETDERRSIEDQEMRTTEYAIKAMREGHDKEMAEIDYEYAKERQSIDRWYEDLRQKKIDNARKLFEANPNNANRIFSEEAFVSGGGAEYTSADNAERDARLKVADTNRAQAMIKLIKAERDMYASIESIRQDSESRAIDMMEDSLEKSLLLIDVSHRKAIEALGRKEQEWRDSQGGELTDEQSAALSEAYKVVDEKQAYDVEQAGEKILEKYRGYFKQREDLIKKYETDRSAMGDADQSYIAELERQQKEALESLDMTFAQRDESFNEWASSIANMGLKQITRYIEEVQQIIAEMEAGDPMNEDIAKYRALLAKLQETVAKGGTGAKKSVSEWKDLYEVLTTVRNGFEEIGETIGGTVGEVVKAAGKIASSVLTMIDGIKTLAASSSKAIESTSEAAGKSLNAVEKASVILTIVSAALQVVTSIMSLFGGEDPFKKFREEIDDLNESMRKTEFYLNLNPDQGFLDADKWSHATNAIRMAGEALAEFNNMSDDASQRYTSAQKMLMMLTGQEITKSIGDFKVQIQHGTWFRSGKYTTLKDAIPELFKEDGSMDMDKLEDVMQSDLFERLSETDRDYIAEIKERWDEYKDAMDEVRDYLDDIFGDLGHTMFDAIEEAFKNGTDAAVEFKGSVSQMLESLARDMIYSVTIAPLLKQAQEDMMAIMGDEDADADAKFKRYVAVLDEFQENAIKQQANANELMETYKTLAKDRGYDIFMGDNEAQRASGGEYTTMSESTATELNGRMAAMQIAIEQMRLGVEAQTTMLSDISGKMDDIVAPVAVEDLRSIMASSYLELVGIRENTEAIIKPIKDMDDRMDRWDEKIMRL